MNLDNDFTETKEYDAGLLLIDAVRTYTVEKKSMSK